MSSVPTSDRQRCVFIIRDDGTGRRRLTTNPFPAECDSDPNVSPDGKTVTFVRHKVDGLLQALHAVDVQLGAISKVHTRLDAAGLPSTFPPPDAGPHGKGGNRRGR